MNYLKVTEVTEPNYSLRHNQEIESLIKIIIVRVTVRSVAIKIKIFVYLVSSLNNPDVGYHDDGDVALKAQIAAHCSRIKAS